MTARRLLAGALACLAAAAAAWSAGARPASGATAPRAAEVALDGTQRAVRLGESFGLRSTITNVGRRPLADLVAHLNVVSLTTGVYVDPEDWSPERTRYLPTLAPGRSVRVGWRVTAVSGGRFAVYVVAIPRRSSPGVADGLAIGRPLTLRVAERRVLDSGGVLVLALGLPALLGLATLVVHGRRRRSQRSLPPGPAAA